ncbi:MAG TPA: sugar ABC transporter permease [Caldilineaceae bacterium]|nr:sugar ABC transporter permease [Caldilineaceae bacterium]
MTAATMPRPVAVRRRPLWKEISRHWVDYLFISPFFITFAVFKLYPLVWALQLSFSQWRGFGPMRYVGLENYRVVLNDPYILQSLVNTLQFAYILLPTGIFLSIVLAVFLNIRNLPGKGVFRTLYFLPYVTSSVIVAIVFTQLFDDHMGWVNRGLEVVGLEPVRWLRGNEWAAKWVVIMLTHWGGLGYNVLLFLGGLQAIDHELYEAARIDGANEWQIFWRITLPLLYPIIFFLTVIATIGLMNMFNQPFMLTDGGPRGATTTLMLRLYEIGIGGQRYGDASAFGFLIGILVIVISVIQIRILRRESH